MGEHAGRRLFRLPVLRGRSEREPAVDSLLLALSWQKEFKRERVGIEYNRIGDRMEAAQIRFS